MSDTAAPEVVGIPNGSLGQNTWLLIDPASRHAVVIDPGEDHPRILAAIRHRDLRIDAIWLTHGHIDHIWGVDEIRGATGAKVWLHPDDRDWYDGFAEQCQAFGYQHSARLAPPDNELADGDVLTFSGWQFEVRHVPGHSRGHVAFVGHGLAASGDVLFHDSIGRSDLPGGDGAQLLHSIRGRLLDLPDDTRVLTGHGPETTVGRERRHNPFLRG